MRQAELLEMMNEEEKRTFFYERTYKAMFLAGVLAALTTMGVFFIGVFVLQNRSVTLENRKIGYQRGAIDCQQLIVDNERTWPLSGYCLEPEVVRHYPQEVCARLGITGRVCGSRS